MEIVREWYRRYFTNPQVVILGLLLLIGFALVIVFSDILAPLFVALVLAYLLEGVVRRLCWVGLPRLPAVLLVFTLFMLLFATVLVILLPKLSRQVTALFQELPSMIIQAEALLLGLPERYPNLFSEPQVLQWVDQIRDEVTRYGQEIVQRTVASVVGIITVVVYIILVPILVLFLMKDKDRIVSWTRAHLPRDRALAHQVWTDVDRQIGNYIRGKFWEILIIFGICYATFSWFGLNFAVLLSLLVGLSVIIPWVGAVIVTIPIAIIAYFQWGFGPEWTYLMIAYFVIQAIDANIVVPLLFSEVVDLHPVAIIAAVLFFGGIWGLWGVFFAIPLATLVQAVLKAWPRHEAVPVLNETQ
ncbi:MAG: AI-2E family transporter [Xanthomonadaceae bacterium]|nr:AI-2E family transporter [Xanthomonadaceae bacterium]